MTFRPRSLLAVLTASLCLTACGGGSTTVQPNPAPNPGPPGPAGSISLSASQLNFRLRGLAGADAHRHHDGAEPGARVQPGQLRHGRDDRSHRYRHRLHRHPNRIGTCAAVITIANVSATFTITVGGSAGLVTVTNSSVSVSVGGAGSFSATATSGTWTVDGTSCHNIANFSTTSTGASVSYNIAPSQRGRVPQPRSTRPATPSCCSRSS